MILTCWSDAVPSFSLFIVPLLPKYIKKLTLRRKIPQRNLILWNALTVSISNLFFSAPSCDHFGGHGDWKKYLAMVSTVFLFSPLIVQEVECVNLKWAAVQNGKFDRFKGVLCIISNVTPSQQLCNDEINHFCY